MRKLVDAMAWAGVATFFAWTLRPVLGNWSGSVLGPFGGIDPMLQLGILQWSAAHWWQPQVWLDLPIFFPLHDMLGCMDSLLGQAWLIWPVHLLFQPSVAAQYNLAFLGSLLLAAAGMAVLWRTVGSRWTGAGVAALALVGAPYTTAQLGHLNQLPPPWVLFCLAAAVAALKRQEQGRSSRRQWWLVGVCFVLQAAWGWYGFAYAVVGVAVLIIVWLRRRVRAGKGMGRDLGTTLKAAWLPAMIAVAAVYLLAQPQLRLSHRYPEFSRSETEVRQGSADIQHLWNRGAYRGRLADWTGRGPVGEERYRGWARQTLHPGWAILLLAVYGWWRRRDLEPEQAAGGRALLLMGLVGLVLAFGDSVGVPGTGVRLPLPLEWLRRLVPPFRAFRGAWRFSWLMTIALAWWAAAGVRMMTMPGGRLRKLAPAVVVVMALMALPMGVPAVAVPVRGYLLPVGQRATGPVLTLPAPVNEYAEDRTEALWIARAQELGRPVTGGATGWVPPPVIALRDRIHDCTGDEALARAFLRRQPQQGIREVELALRPGDGRVDFWRRQLQAVGAVSISGEDNPGYQRYRLPDEQAGQP